MVGLAARLAPESAWEEFAQRHKDLQLQPHEEVEVIEFRALTALRNGLVAESRRLYERAFAISAAKPNLLSERLKRRYASSFGSQPRQASS
jgi:hypothetical protein